MAELNDDTPTRFPHEDEEKYRDRKSKYMLILERYPDPDDAAAMSMVYSNMVYLHARYPAAVEQRIAFIEEIANLIAQHRDDSAARIGNIMSEAASAITETKNTNKKTSQKN